jgi:serine/threonine protein kinase
VTAEKGQSAAAYEIPVGSFVGKYEILRRIAVGGMAEIYLARARGTAGFEKLVVLKRILPGVAADPTFVQMFLDEARLAATLQHPNIADVYDVGEEEGAYFFTMEFVHGQDVRAIRHEIRKRGDNVPLAVGLAIVHGVASALDYAHDKTGPDGKKLGLVHRDVSSSNVLVSYDGAIKLVDFGIARATVSQHKTQTGTLKGKIPYMSPEQCQGLVLDRRSDLFSLGVLLYELTVGKRPFRGESEFAIMDQIVYKGTARPSEVVAGYPLELEAIVLRLLERDPEKRYASADEVIHDLDTFMAANHLWLSAKQVGKFMRLLFADRIRALEEAESKGIPFVQHVATTITSQSQRSEAYTPGSALNAAPVRKSQEMGVQRVSSIMRAAERPTPTPRPAVRPITIPTGEVILEAPPKAVMPDLRPRSSRFAVISVVAILVVGGGGLAYYLMSGAQEPAEAAKEKPEDVHKMDVTAPAVAPTPTPAPAAPAPVAKQPAPEKKLEPEKKPEPEPTKIESKPPVKVASPQVVVPKKNVIKTSRPDKPDKPDKPEKPDKPDTKEQKWDPNSPLLPQ